MGLRVGQKVTAKYLATSAGARCPGDWFQGTISKVNADGTYNILYADGDKENAVQAKFVKAHAEEVEEEVVEEVPAAASRRAGKRRMAAPEDAQPAAEPAAAASRRAGKRRMTDATPPEPEPQPMDADDDDEVAIVEGGANASSRALVPAPAAGTTYGEDEDDEVEVVGRTGELALVDFPHSREFCMTKPFSLPGKQAECCPNCYCYVCDGPASACPEWKEHCMATHDAPKWQTLRASWKAHGGKPPSASSGGAGAVSSSSSAAAADDDGAGGGGSSSSPVASRYVQRSSCDELLAGIQQVYPREEAEPAGFTPALPLRPYQKQSLAFMIDRERSTDPGEQGQRGLLVQRKHSGYRRYMFGSDWYTPDHITTRPARGGWLCDEVGMGKTAVIAALVLANQASVKPVPDDAFAKLLTPEGTPRDFAVTVVIVNNTLVQQWADELKKFAPGLNVCMYYGDNKKKSEGLKALRSMDVLLTTPHMSMPDGLLRNMRVHRLVVDESHLLAESGSTTHSKLGTLSQYQASFVWLVTGTPFTSSLTQLTNQARLLGQWLDGVKLAEIETGVPDPNASWPPKPGDRMYSSYVAYPNSFPRPRVDMPNATVVERLRKVMIRHTKSMRIGGEVALALPDADCSTVWLTMSADERLMYNVHRCIQPPITSTYGDYLSQCTQQLNACSHLYSDEVVCGAHHIFNKAVAAGLGLKDAYVYASQLGAHHTLERQLKKGLVIEEKTRGADGEEVVTYKRTDEAIRNVLCRFSGPPPTEEERNKHEIYPTGDGDETKDNFPRQKPTLQAPVPMASFPKATEAFLATHEKQMVAPPKLSADERKRVERGYMDAPPDKVERYVSNSKLTKFRRLMDDLVTLRQSEPHFRVIVFTRHSTVQERLVALIESETRANGSLAPLADGSKVVCFEFTQKTAPQARHRLISQFQGSGGGARIFIVTYAVAAVGITLTAANRIFLMEPCIDPAQEIQAAGRIHRLGQTKDCFITRFAFKDSIEEAVIELQERIKSKEVKVVDGKLDAGAAAKALAKFQEGKTTHAFSGDTCVRSFEGSDPELPWKQVQGADAQYEWQYSSHVVPGSGGLTRREVWKQKEDKWKEANWWSGQCTQRACIFCGLYEDLPGTFSWKGGGLYSYLDGDTRNPPKLDRESSDSYHSYYGARRFLEVPRPPDGWMGLSDRETNNGGKLPSASDAKGKRRGRSSGSGTSDGGSCSTS